METTSTSSTETPMNPEPPVRILFQTLTHLLPGEDNYDRTGFMIDMICQHHWGCPFKGPRFRWKSYNVQYAFNNRRCFFLVDHGQAENDKDVPILSYEWTGESLKPLPNLAKDPEITAILEKYAPFTYQRPGRKERPIRKNIKWRLHCLESIPVSEMEYVRERPEDMEWLSIHLRPRLWREFVAQVNAKKAPGAPDIQE